MKHFTFERDPDNLWYVVLPDYPGPRADLLMVQGADDMLDILSNLQGNTDKIHLSVAEKDFIESRFSLHFKREENDGGWYKLKSVQHNFDVWLCKVMKYLYGELPLNLYVA